MLEKIQELMAEVEALQAKSATEVEALRIKYLSKKGKITALMADFRNVSADQKREVGIKINELKNVSILCAKLWQVPTQRMKILTSLVLLIQSNWVLATLSHS